eukprot:scaffold1018_cov420-Prasinococcus_capsulatus_cf.AAC.9
MSHLKTWGSGWPVERAEDANTGQRIARNLAETHALIDRTLRRRREIDIPHETPSPTDAAKHIVKCFPSVFIIDVKGGQAHTGLHRPAVPFQQGTERL